MMTRLVFPFTRLSPQAPRLVSAVAIFAAAAGLGVWGAILFAPVPAKAPAPLNGNVAARHDTAALAQWFGDHAESPRIVIIGLIASGQDGAALLAVNGRPAVAYRVGQTLAPGMRLNAVLPQAIKVELNGLSQQIEAPHPMPVAHGITFLAQ